MKILARTPAAWLLAAGVLAPPANAQEPPSAELAAGEAGNGDAQAGEQREPTLQDRLEAVETARLNREAAEFTARQVAAENEAVRSKAEADRRAFEEALARRARDALERQRAQAATDAEFERTLAEQRRRDVEYQASLARHKRCEDGSWRACNDIKQGTLLSEEQLSAAAATLTDADVRHCVASPVVSPNESFEGSTRALVVNRCETAVDVRICLLRTDGWNCGMSYALKPQDSGVHWAFETQGEVFWDARATGSTRPMADPG